MYIYLFALVSIHVAHLDIYVSLCSDFIPRERGLREEDDEGGVEKSFVVSIRHKKKKRNSASMRATSQPTIGPTRGHMGTKGRKVRSGKSGPRRQQISQIDIDDRTQGIKFSFGVDR